jgi:iron complex transport system ATP-binding protein
MLELKSCRIGKGEPLYTIENVAIGAGKLTALVGANGAGKSTLLDAIALGNDCGGRIVYDGRSLQDIKIFQRSRYIALVESRFSGSEYLSTREYLDLGRYPHTGFSGRLHPADETVVKRFAARLKLEHLLSRSTLTLSDGERQRAGIARALIQETPVILLDEPTSFLDYPNKRLIMELLSEIARSEDKIVLLASHDLELCLEYCDDFLLINPKTQQLEQYDVNGLTLDRVIELAFPPEE